MATHKINCNVCKSLVSLFYNKSMSKTVRSAIIGHLAKCDDCLNHYDNYESNHPEVVQLGIKKLIKKLRQDIDLGSMDGLDEFNDNIAEITSSYTVDSNADGSHFNPTKWQDAASTFDIETLMNLKAFRDLINTYDYDKTYADLDYSKFYKHITKKITKKIDFLEACILKEYKEESRDDKSNNKSLKRIVKDNLKDS